MQDSLGNTDYTYDAAHRLTSSTFTYSLNPASFTVGYNLYDENGNLKELTYPGGKKVIYTYDELNRLKTVKIDWLNQTATYNYDDAGRLTSLTNFNDTVTTYGYDNANRLTSLDNKKSDTTTILASYGFTLDGNGNRTQTVQSEPLTLTPNTETVSYGYNAQKNRLLTANTTGFGYDNEGQLLWSKDGADTYMFDEAHRLTHIDSGSNYAEFSYDGTGNRLRADRDWVETRYVYDAGGNLLMEVDTVRGTSYYIHGIGLMAMVTDTGQVYTYHYNAVGSTIAMTDSTQTVVNKYSYDPFGNILNQTETVNQPFKFVGQFGVMTEPNGFYYMRARYYDPEVGRFISEDPIGFEGGDTNLCAYVRNQPVNLIDPNGQCPWCVGAVVGGISGAVGGFTSGLISGDGSLKAAVGGGIAGGLAGAAVGLVNPFAGTATGEAIGSIVGGIIGGGVGSAASQIIDNKAVTLNSTGLGMVAGGLSATIASPVVWASAAIGASDFATSIAGGTMAIFGDTVVATGAAIYNKNSGSSCGH